jgi:hypothetical protein
MFTSGPRAPLLLAGWLLAARAAAAPPLRPEIPAPWWGVTIDSVRRLPEIEAALTGFSRTLTARVVFDGPETATAYRDAVAAIRRHAYVMGELWDSYDFKACGVDRYRARTEEYHRVLGGLVDVWEVGNEVNGEWTGADEDVVAKVRLANDYLKARGERTALTLVYNEGCWEREDHEMFRWAATRLAPSLRDRFDYVLLSYYQEDCGNRWPDWTREFTRLQALFPASRVGFGEVGSEKGDKPGLLKRYYALDPGVPGYLGGYFWWFFNQDMVPKTKPLWTTLRAAVARGRGAAGAGRAR